MDNIFSRFYERIISTGSNLESLFLLAIRLFFGISFLLAGYGKLQNIEQTAAFFSKLGIPFSLASAYIASSIELVGGGMLVIGFASRLAALLLMIVMAVAILTAHFESVRNAIENPNGLISLTAFVFLLASLIIFIFGPGKASLDYLIERAMGRSSD